MWINNYNLDCVGLWSRQQFMIVKKYKKIQKKFKRIGNWQTVVTVLDSPWEAMAYYKNLIIRVFGVCSGPSQIYIILAFLVMARCGNGYNPPACHQWPFLFLLVLLFFGEPKFLSVSSHFLQPSGTQKSVNVVLFQLFPFLQSNYTLLKL
jgi:hypothetical protein